MSGAKESRRNMVVLVAVALVVGGVFAALVYSAPPPTTESVEPSTNCVSTTAYLSYPCVFVEAVDLKSSVLYFEVGNQGGFNVTLFSATINGSASNAGFTGSVSMSLNYTMLGVNGAMTFAAPPLSGVRAGDRVSVEVVTTADTYYIKNATL